MSVTINVAVTPLSVEALGQRHWLRCKPVAVI
jgi:hypothetical protein